MDKVYIVANWKSYKTESEAEEWFGELKIPRFAEASRGEQDLEFTNKEIIICPSFTSLPILKSLIINHKSNIKLGAQNISPFDEGTYTGEVSAKQIKDLANYVIIGHSERRKNFAETEKVVFEKLTKTLSQQLIPILCVSEIIQLNDVESLMKDSNMIIAYEPLSAIGSGNPDNPENANDAALKIKKISTNTPVLYGGSVDSDNVKSFTAMENINGVLVGNASLDPLKFLEIIKNA